MSANLPVPVLVGEVLNPPTPSALPIPVQADSDRDLVAMWVARSASPGSRRKYRAQAARFLAFVAKPLAPGPPRQVPTAALPLPRLGGQADRARPPRRRAGLPCHSGRPSASRPR